MLYCNRILLYMGGVMNDNFIAAVKKSNKSQYKIAKESGVPFSTINALFNGKQSVNNCATATILRLSVVIGEDFLSLLDPYPLLDNTCGEYEGIKYTWKYCDGSMQLLFDYRGEHVVINTGLQLNIPAKQSEYATIAEWNIDRYLRNKRFEAYAKELSDA